MPGKIVPQVVGLVLVFVCGQAAAALYIYQVPGGTRIVTDRPIKNKDYVLIRKSNATFTLDELVAQQRAETVWTDAGRYAGLIHKTAIAHRVEPALVKAVMHAESAFDPYAVSRRGAQGLMQLTPETARRYGVRDVFDPAQNIEGGVRFLRDLMRAFSHNSDLALAAYNAGPQAVWRHNGVPPYDETRAYIRKVRLFQDYYGGKRARPAPATVAELAIPESEEPVVIAPAEPESGTIEDGAQQPPLPEGPPVPEVCAIVATDAVPVVEAVVARAERQTLTD